MARQREERVFGKKKKKSGKGAPRGDSGAHAPGKETAAGEDPGTGAGAAGTPPPGPQPGEPGSRIGRYSLISILGQGGMGKVYLARDPVIDRQVALKVISIRPDLSEEEAGQYRERFLREAQAAGALVHPNIVAVHDIGQDPATGSPYIVMEHVPGQDLKKVILSHAPMPAEQAAGIVMQIASALDYAHKRGIVHRDIKPANVLIDPQGRVKLTDFGVARLPGSDLTRADQFVGSPGFMSPEQLSGGTVDGRSDLFALGVILYQLLTGRAPFEGETISEILYRVSTQPAEPPSEAQADVSPDFDPILETALAKDPAHRFQTGHEMIEALRRTTPSDAGEPASPAAEAPTTDPAGIAPGFRVSPWFTLSSQWRLGALVAILMLALIGLNWGIVTLFHGPLGSSVRLGGEDDRPAAPPRRFAARSEVRVAGTMSPGGGILAPAGGASAGRIGTGRPPQTTEAARQALDAARDGLESQPREELEADAEVIASGKPITAVCATSYAGPLEIARVLDAARRSRTAKTAAVSLPSPDRPSGRIRLEIRHRMKSGRLVVLVDGKTVLSKPFDTDKGKSGTITHLLSVPAGRHGVVVRLLEGKGAVASEAKVTGKVVKNEVALLQGEQRSGGNRKLELDWQTSP